MKKLIALTLTLITLLTLTAPATAELDEDFMEIFAVVTALDYVEDTVTCLDDHGVLWTFYEIEDLFIGDKMLLTVWMPTNEIVDVRYIGYLTPQEMAAYVHAACE